MKSFVDAISEAEKVGSQHGKFKALSGIRDNEQRLIVEALNPYRVFHVKKWKRNDNRHAGTDAPIEKFYQLLDNLHDRRLSGNAAVSAVQDTLSWYTPRTAEYLARVLRKDLNCGAKTKTFNKIYPNLKIPIFNVMLAVPMDESYVWRFPTIAEYKYDGQRVIAFVDPNEVEYVTREGRPASFCDGLFDDELTKIATLYGQPLVIDGEVLSKTFQDTMIAKGSSSNKKELKYYVFDWMERREWDKKFTREKQVKRSHDLERIVNTLALNRVIKTESAVLENEDDASNYYAKALENGLEGLIIKDPSAFYQWSRKSAWTKWKPKYQIDLEIIEVIRGKSDGKYRDTCGSIHLKGYDEKTKRKIDTYMGSGLSDRMRDWFWENRNTVPSKTMETECGEFTRAKNSDTWSLRFPVYKKLRDDK